MELSFQEKDKRIQEFLRLARISGNYMQPFHDRALRMYKIYNALMDEIAGLDDEEKDAPRTFLPYAYGIIENLLSSIIEMLFDLKPPCRVKPKKEAQAKQAENFSNYMRNVYSESDFQKGYTRGSREEMICGWSWMRDEYTQKATKGKKWAFIRESGITKTLINVLGKVIPIKSKFSYDKLTEIDHLYTEKKGFEVKFPSIFDVFPEPGKRSVKDMQWCLEVERDVALVNLKNDYVQDPKDAKNKIPLYDLTDLEKEYGGSGEEKQVMIRPGALSPFFQFDYHNELQQALRNSSLQDQFQGDNLGDVDRVHLVYVRKKEHLYVIAVADKGTYLIANKPFPFHKPKIPLHLSVYVEDNLTPFGVSALMPIEYILYELNDIHQLSMQSYFHFVNKRMLVKEDSMVDLDDFSSKAGGIVRVKNTSNVSDVAMPIEHTDATSSMLAQESNAKGIIEWASGAADLSPGVEGTKQTHDTLGGLIEIQKNIAKRINTLRRQKLSIFQEQMTVAHEMLEQFQFDTVIMDSYNEKGQAKPGEFSREDLIMEDGPNLIIEYDPAYGDETVLRNHLMFALNLAMKFDEYRLTKRPDLPIPNLAEHYRKMLNSLGWEDTSNMLKEPDGVIKPEEELEIILSGQPVQPNPKEDLISHYTQHLGQVQVIQQLIVAGKATPQMLLALQSHIMATKQMIMFLLNKPKDLMGTQSLGLSSNGAQPLVEASA